MRVATSYLPATGSTHSYDHAVLIVAGSASAAGIQAAVVAKVPSGWRNWLVPDLRTRTSTPSTPVSSDASPEITSGGSSSTLSSGAGLVSTESGAVVSVAPSATTPKLTGTAVEVLPATSTPRISAW